MNHNMRRIKLPKEKAVAHIQRLLDTVESLKSTSTSNPGFEKWKRTVKIVIEEIFHDSTRYAKEFDSIEFYPSRIAIAARQLNGEDAWINALNEGLESAYALLDSIIYEVEEFAEEDMPVQIVSKKHQSKNSMKQQKSNLDIFISHSSQDAELAEALTDLIKAALPIDPARIRCTSVAGHRLRAGSDIDNTLREELLAAATFVGIITPNSMQSAFVLMEMGGRWATNKHFIPLMAKADASVLAGPLKGLHALNARNEAELHQLIEEIAEVLHVEPRRASVYLKKLQQVVALASINTEVVHAAVQNNKVNEEEADFQRDYILKLQYRVIIRSTDWVSSPLPEEELGSVQVSLKDIFIPLAQALTDEAEENEMWQILTRLIQRNIPANTIDAYEARGNWDVSIDEDTFNEIRSDLILRGLIEKSDKHGRSAAENVPYWTLTSKGRQWLRELKRG